MKEFKIVLKELDDGSIHATLEMKRFRIFKKSLGSMSGTLNYVMLTSGQRILSRLAHQSEAAEQQLQNEAHQT